MMDDFEPEKQFLSDALPELENYLFSKELYWPLGGKQTRLTLGNVLLNLRQLQAGDPVAAGEFAREYEASYSRRKTAWEAKMTRETANRLRLWQAFVTDYEENPESNASAYPGQVRHRVILQLLLEKMPADLPELKRLDDTLKISLRPGAFLWHKVLQPAYPEAVFWFLYGKLPFHP